ncbi:BMC domain-containing protein [Clostridium minihomine]|uniref:BMC domain-containing protein n=1 Tax=Clostridium minihomine TaxID=2045012 RepID=UPI000C78A411|nr:BMC domain-containing protein [Clostridium minihomine]
MSVFGEQGIERIIQESVPGKQITLAHVIASPVKDVFERLGIDDGGAIGILTLSPFESAIIAADIAAKTANVEIGFLDRFTGSVVIYGDVQSVETSLRAVNDTLRDLLDFQAAPLTRT